VLLQAAVMAVRPGPTPIRDTAATDRPVARRRITPRRVAALAGIVAVLALSAFAARHWLAGERSIDRSRLRIAQAERGTLVRDAAVNGRVVAAVSPTLYAPVPGTVVLAIRAGDSVTRGTVLATIESPELDNQLARERALLEELAAQLGGARIASDRQRLAARREADEATIALTAATRELERAEAALAAKIITELEYQKAVDALAGARIRDRNARAGARLAGQSAGFDVDTARTQHQRQQLVVADLERRVGELTIRAPVDGVVGTVAVADRAAVAANAPLMTVVDLSRLELELEVPETYADDLGIGMVVEVAVGAGKPTGTLVALSPEVVRGHVLARVRFAGEQPAGLRQSQRLSARILIEERPDVVMVQRGPFVDAHGGRYIYVVDGDLAIRRDIRIGAVSVSAVEIVDGLAAGEKVVIAGSDSFEDAGRVHIND
jgi:HlyD family secretion protein